MSEGGLYNQVWGKRQVDVGLLRAGKPLVSYTMTIETTIDYAQKTVVVDQRTGRLDNVYRYIVETKEKQIHKGLVALGWTPPPRTSLFWLLRARLATWLKDKE